MPPPPKNVLHAGNPQASPIPKAAMFLMRNEDRGQEDDTDPTDGGPATPDDSPEAPVPPELQAALQDLVDQYGSEVVQSACEQLGGDDSALGDTAIDDQAAASAGDDGDHEYR